ncbi:MAG TPA: hypothetical protein VJ343_00665 [archaeon]|nr:hypothetical protein [archaeon]
MSRVLEELKGKHVVVSYRKDYNKIEERIGDLAEIDEEFIKLETLSLDNGSPETLLIHRNTLVSIELCEKTGHDFDTDLGVGDY